MRQVMHIRAGTRGGLAFFATGTVRIPPFLTLLEGQQGSGPFWEITNERTLRACTVYENISVETFLAVLRYLEERV